MPLLYIYHPKPVHENKTEKPQQSAPTSLLPSPQGRAEEALPRLQQEQSLLLPEFGSTSSTSRQAQHLMAPQPAQDGTGLPTASLPPRAAPHIHTNPQLGLL